VSEAEAPGPVTCQLAGHEVALDAAALAKKYASVEKATQVLGAT
jgi:hypothetical protein